MRVPYYIVICGLLASPFSSFATTVSQLKISDFSGGNFKGFEALYFSVSATTTQVLSSGEFCKLRYDTMPVQSASANFSFYTNVTLNDRKRLMSRKKEHNALWHDRNTYNANCVLNELFISLVIY